jgi:hypothetical protein
MALYANQLQITGNSPVSINSFGSSTALAYFPAPSGSVPPSLSVTSGQKGIIVPPGYNVVNGQTMRLQACGNFTVGVGATTSPNVVLSLYPVTFSNSTIPQPTIGSSAIVAATFPAASESSSGYYPWALDLELAGDSLSGLVQLLGGYFSIDGIAETVTQGLATGLSGINFGNQFPFGAVLGMTMSQIDPGASANLYQFRFTY